MIRKNKGNSNWIAFKVSNENIGVKKHTLRTLTREYSLLFLPFVPLTAYLGNFFASVSAPSFEDSDSVKEPLGRADSRQAQLFCYRYVSIVRHGDSIPRSREESTKRM